MPEPTPTHAVERSRIGHRRAALRLEEDEGKAPIVGLALSGGGIRSATFAFGVLQTLAKTAVVAPAEALTKSLLGRVDYLSTVSGGTYIGAFLGSLFVPGRAKIPSDPATPADPVEDAVTAAVRAYDIVACDPPPRIRRKDDYAQLPTGSAHTAWLRENGRYLTPTGAGDLVYGAVTQVRNWFAMQYVVGVTLVALFSLILLVGIYAETAANDYLAQSRFAIVRTCAELLPFFITHPLWLLPLAIVALGVLPSGIAFWLTHPVLGQDDGSPPRLVTAATVLAAAIPATIFVATVAMWTWRGLDTPSQEGALAWIAGVLLALALGHYAVTMRGNATIGAHRVTLTRDLVVCVEVAAALAGVLAVYSLGQLAYLELRVMQRPEISLGVIAGAVVWALRRAAALADDKVLPQWARALPLDLVALVLGLVLWLVVGVTWAAFAYGWAFSDYLATGNPLALDALPIHATFLILVGGILAAITGMFPGFVNLSTLHALYAARLTRAYLGASNGLRFAPHERTRGRSVAEPMPGDQLDVQTYYGTPEHPTLAPVHLVNATLNQTTDAAEQLVQRDRKGRPLALTPAGYTVDGVLHASDPDDVSSDAGTRMNLGQWIAVSGAAVSTGLGRATSLGLSLLLGFANIRLGRWWCAAAASGDAHDTSDDLDAGFFSLRSQRLLWQEFTARFHGTRRRWQYLSDGGHFENTGIYELLRPERGVSLVIACDDGCDASYAFGDFANLIRLARIDYGLDIVEADVAGIPALAEVIIERGVAGGGSAPATDNRCAMLFDAYRRDDAAPTRTPLCRILVLKPRVIRDLPLDVREYATTHPAFPQESTADQFFDEAQWESYRKLGVAIAHRVLTPPVLRHLAL
jgi:hypothetical protein